MESGVGLLGNATVVPDASPTEGISQFSPRIVAQSRSSSRRVQARRRTFVIVCVACFLSPALFFSKLRWGSGEGSWRIGRKRSKDHEAEAVSSTRRACVPPAQKVRCRNLLRLRVTCTRHGVRVQLTDVVPDLNRTWYELCRQAYRCRITYQYGAAWCST